MLLLCLIELSIACCLFRAPIADCSLFCSNIWGPHRQQGIVDLLGNHYIFSPRLLAIIRSEPAEPEPKSQDKPVSRFKSSLFHKDDVEVGESSMDTPMDTPSETLPLGNPRSDTTHYAIAKQMINFQSIDIGSRCECLGVKENRHKC
jgi:hypothetical protein